MRPGYGAATRGFARTIARVNGSPRLLALSAAALLVAAGCVSGPKENQPPPHPNILIIITDDQRPTGTMGVMPKTRHWLGDGGTTYPRGVVTTPVCCPSRSSIFSGLYVHNHGVKTNEDAEKLAPGHLLQTYLQGDGYRTSIIGKYLVHPGPYDDPAHASIDPPHFDDWKTFLGGYRNTLFNVNGDLQRVHEYATRYIADSAVQQLDDYENDDAQPWFLYVAPFAPHFPWVPATRYKDATLPPWHPSPSVRRPSAAGKPPWVARARVRFSQSVKARNHQLRTLMSVDDLVGRVMTEADRLGELNDTLVFFLSDNGYHWGEHGLSEKSSPYLESVGVPFFVRWPGHIAEGTTDGRLVANIDIAPTALSAAGIAPTRPMDGKSLLSPSRHRYLLLEHWKESELNLKVPNWDGLLWKSSEYIWTPSPGKPAFQEYYDLKKDPYEQNNLASRPAMKPRLRVLERRLQRARRCAGVNCP
jgi:arylsulfatase A-like enzyme